MPLPPDIEPGFLYSHVSDDVRAYGLRMKGNTEVSFSVETEDAEEYGSSADPIGATRGRNKYALSLTLLLSAWEGFCQDCDSKGIAPMKRAGSIVWVISEPGQPTITMRANVNKLKKMELAAADGPDAHKVKVEATVLKILRNGRAIA